MDTSENINCISTIGGHFDGAGRLRPVSAVEVRCSRTERQHAGGGQRLTPGATRCTRQGGSPSAVGGLGKYRAHTRTGGGAGTTGTATQADPGAAVAHRCPDTDPNRPRAGGIRYRGGRGCIPNCAGPRPNGSNRGDLGSAGGRYCRLRSRKLCAGG